MAALLALAGCGSEKERPGGPGPAPGGASGALTALVFADSALQSAVEEAAAGTGDAALLVSLRAQDRGIADLGGIDQLTRLEILDLYGNEIRELSPLAGLRRLRYLDLGANRIEEVSALSSLTSLQVLLLADNEVTEVSALAGLDSLQNLDLTGNPLGDSATTQLAALRERGVTVEVTVTEREDWVEVVGPDGPVLGDQQLLFSSSRRLQSSRSSDREVHSLDLETGEVVSLSSPLAAAPLADGWVPDANEPSSRTRSGSEPARSPEGARVAFVSVRDGNQEIYLMAADGGRPVNLTRHDASDSSPAWSPDGWRIAFQSWRASGEPHIFVMNHDGSGLEQLTNRAMAPGSGALAPAWSPDGSSIACVSAQGGVRGIFALDTAGGGLRLLFASTEDQRAGDPAWSPDGAWIAYTVLDRNTNLRHVWVMAADGSGARQVTFTPARDSTPTWSPDGTRIAFARQSTKEPRYDIWIVPVEGGTEERVTDDPHDDLHPDWTPF